MAMELLSFSFDETLEDSVSGLSATGSGDIDFTVGVEGNALVLNGTDTYLDFSSDMLSNIGDEYSIAFWQYGTGEKDRESILMDAYSGGNSIIRIRMVMILDGVARIGIEHNSEVASEKQASCFYLGSWNHWVFTVNAANNSMILYRNGEIIFQRHNAEIVGVDITSIRIGASSGGDMFYLGQIDNFLIYQGELSLAEIREIVAGGRVYAPSPANAAYLLRKDNQIQTLRWKYNKLFDWFDVYLGISYDQVLQAAKNSPEYQGQVSYLEFSPSGLLTETPYYWRIDAVKNGIISKGLPWKMISGVYSGEQYAGWGQETINTIERDFRIRGYNGYYEDSLSNGWSFVWPNSIYLMALSSAAKINRNRFVNVINNYIIDLDSHLTLHNNIYGYDVSANPVISNRFYDDNSWVSVAMCDAYEVTNDPEHLRRSVLAYDFTLSGETSDLGGGIWWKETYTVNDPQPEKAMSATAGAMHAGAKLYAVTGDERYLNDFKRLLQWTLTTLQDKDGLIFNSIHEDGSIDYVKWAYNTGVTALACLKIYEKNSDSTYLDLALQMGRDSVTYWLDSDKGTIYDSACFGFTLTDLYMRLYEVTDDLYWESVADACLQYVHYSRDNNDRYPYYPLLWNTDRLDEYTEYGLLYTAPNARAFWTLAADGAQQITKENAINGTLIQTFASSNWPNCLPENTVSGVGIVNDMHDNAPDASTMWHTLEGGQGDINPSPGNYSGPAWIQFVFDKVYALDDMWIYNHNQLQQTGRGLRDVYVEYSADGETWELLGEFRLNEAAGAESYPYNNEIFFHGITAKAVLITAKVEGGNFGQPYYGLSAVRFGLASASPT